MQRPIVIKQGTSIGQVSMQPGMVTEPLSVNSSLAVTIPNAMALNKPGSVVVTTQNMEGGQPALLPNVQILNMRDGAPAASAQKFVANVTPRVAIEVPQVVHVREAAPGLTLRTLQSLQPGQHARILLKTDNGQYQLLSIGHTPAASTPAAPSHTLRRVPIYPGVASVSTRVMPAQMQIQGHMARPVVHVSSAAPRMPTPMPQVHHQSAASSYKPSDNTKEKCRNFFANVLDLSSKKPPPVGMNVQALIQELIDSQVELEEFCDRLQKLLNASPQPGLIGFLKKSLPLLRQSMVTKELVIDGITPPAPHIAFGIQPLAPIVITAKNYVPQMHPGVASVSTRVMPAQMQIQELMARPVVHVSSAAPPVPTPMPQVHHQPAASSYKPVPKPGNKITVLQNIPVYTKINMSKGSSSKGGVSKGNLHPGGPSAALSTVLTPRKSILKNKEKKFGAQYTPQQYSEDKMAGDDDINDVTAMGGVNLAEKSQRILRSTDLIGTQIRSCKDDPEALPLMKTRVKTIAPKFELEEPGSGDDGILSHAAQERLNSIVEKLTVIAQHRNMVKADNRHECTQDVKGQLKFQEELDRVDKKRRDDSERELLMKAAKSRSKNEDPEQAKLKAKAKEMQRAELEELRQREANLTALQVIGPRKNARMDAPGVSGDLANPGPSTSSNLTALQAIGPRKKACMDAPGGSGDLANPGPSTSSNLTALQAIGPRKKARMDAPGGSGDLAMPGPSTSSNLTALQVIGPRKKARMDAPGGSGDLAMPGPSTSSNLTALQAIGLRKKARMDAPEGSGDLAMPGPSTSSGITGRSQLEHHYRLVQTSQRGVIFLIEQDNETQSTTLYKCYRQ